MNINIIIATHKKYKFPKDKMYLPLHVGASDKKSIGYKKDNSGKNISKKNPYFCELTGLYWAYKNLNCDYIGLVHYRRHFKGKTKSKDVFNKVLTKNELMPLLKKYDIILPKKRKYYIENLYSHYIHTHHEEELIKTRQIIEKKYPKYLLEFDRLKKRTSAHMFNMMIMKKDKLDEYCNWLFDILFELEKNIDSTKYDSFHARFYGRVSELLLDVWINTNNYKYTEVPFICIEKTNWFKKGYKFLKAKFKGEKYDKSF